MTQPDTPATPAAATPEAIAAELERAAADLDTLSRKPESLNDKPHWNRIRGRVASLRYSANAIRERLTPAWDALARDHDEARRELAEALAMAIDTADRDEYQLVIREILGEFKPGSPPVTSWHVEASVSDDRIADWRKRAGLEG